MTKDEMVGCHHPPDEPKFEQALGDRTGKPDILQSMGLQRIVHD